MISATVCSLKQITALFLKIVLRSCMLSPNNAIIFLIVYIHNYFWAVKELCSQRQIVQEFTVKVLSLSVE